MIQANLQLIRKSSCIIEKEGKPISKDFESIREMSDWVSKQNEHPFLGYIILNYIEHIELPNSMTVCQEFTWDNWKAAE